MRHLAAIVSLIFAGIFFLCVSPAHADNAAPPPAPPRVIVSIKPLHSLVAGVMGNTGTPKLIVGGAQSPHGYQLTPSEVETLQTADILFYIGPQMETFLTRTLDTMPASVKKYAMFDAPGIKILPLRSGGDFEADADEGPNPKSQDPHIWLNVGNARAMVAEIAKDLSAEYPQNKDVYAANAAALDKKLATLDKMMKERLSLAKNKPYVVFHDAFQYMEKDYGLKAVGSITAEPDQEPSAARLAEIIARIKSSGATCVFSEPQFNSSLINTVSEQAKVRTSILDEHGADLQPGGDLYFELMGKIAYGFVSCLSAE